MQHGRKEKGEQARTHGGRLTETELRATKFRRFREIIAAVARIGQIALEPEGLGGNGGA
jgi:hypothetical protein